MVSGLHSNMMKLMLHNARTLNLSTLTKVCDVFKREDGPENDWGNPTMVYTLVTKDAPCSEDSKDNERLDVIIEEGIRVLWVNEEQPVEINDRIVYEGAIYRVSAITRLGDYAYRKALSLENI